jgi:hypothetical protein
MDLYTLIQNMINDGTVQTIARNSAAQFGRPGRAYLGASLLPEMTVEENAYREEAIRFRTVVANDGTRYSPAQLKQGDLFASFLVELGESDIAREFSSRDYDALLRFLASNQSMEAVAAVTRWLDTTVNLALVEHNEKQRWQALIDAQVVRVGDNALAENVEYSDPDGHRVSQSNQWSDDSTDIFDEIFTMADLLASKGLTVGRMVTSRQVLSIMAGNDKVKARGGVAVVSPTGQIQGAAGRATMEVINGILQSDGLPGIELYDLQYRTQTGTEYFLKRDVFAMFATTGREATVDLGDEETLLPDTLGYTAIGRPAGQGTPGRVIRMEAFDNKPPRIEAEGWQTSLPVVTEPEAIGIIHSIN